MKCKKIHALRVTTGCVLVGYAAYFFAFASTLGLYQAQDIGEIAWSPWPQSLYEPHVAVSYSTYLGGWWFDEIEDIITDSDGNVYVVGTTSSSDLPMTINAIGYWCYSDAFVAKFDHLGNLLFVRYIGGYSSDWGHAVAIDGLGNIYIGGTAGSSDFPSTAVLGSRGWTDLFVAKINSAGDMQYSVVIAGSLWDSFGGLVADAAGNVYLTGSTSSADFPTTDGSVQPAKEEEGNDAFVVKLDDGGNIVYSTFYGFNLVSEDGLDIAVDDIGSVYIAGTRYMSYSGGGHGPLDVLVFKLDNSGSSVIFEKYIQTAYYDDIAYGIAVDNNGNCYVTGRTASEDFPSTHNAFKKSIDFSQGDHTDAFVFKLSQDGNSLLYSTYLGGSGNDDGRCIALKTNGEAVVAGWSTSNDFQTNTTYGGAEEDIFVACLNADGSDLQYCFKYGGEMDDNVLGMTVDHGFIHLAGYTDSPDFPKKNALQLGFDGFFRRNRDSIDANPSRNTQRN